jgi:hypothetical protein
MAATLNAATGHTEATLSLLQTIPILAYMAAAAFGILFWTVVVFLSI